MIVLNKKIIFIVTSTINPPQQQLSYTQIRSIFSPQERLEQTICTIESIRKNAPESLIVFLENSTLSQGQESIISDSCDWFISFANDKRASRLRDGTNKGLAETYMLRYLLELLTPFRYERLFKISGRYQLTASYESGLFSIDKICGKITGDSFSTRLYSVPKIHEQYFIQLLTKILAYRTRGLAIEQIIMKNIDQKLMRHINTLGVTGYVAVNGELINE